MVSSHLTDRWGILDLVRMIELLGGRGGGRRGGRGRGRGKEKECDTVGV
jgi:hypothetical protein